MKKDKNERQKDKLKVIANVEKVKNKRREGMKGRKRHNCKLEII
jgi:hypothetical protein